MDANLINALGTLGFGGGGIAIVAYLAFQYGKAQLENHKTSIETVCGSYEANTKRICDSFDNDLARRDIHMEYLVQEVRSLRAGIING